MYWRIVEHTYALDAKHGFGILFQRKGELYYKCFYEDGTLVSMNGVKGISSAINELERSDRRTRNSLRTADDICRKLTDQATCTFLPGENTSLEIDLNTKDGSFELIVAKDERHGYYNVKCSCGKKSCNHVMAAAYFLNQHMRALEHAYVVSDLGVDKTAFLERDLVTATCKLDTKAINPALMEDIRHIIQLLDSAKSEDYYWQYHEYVLNLSGSYDYNSTYLEDNYSELLLALFEDPGYRKAVLDTGSYADPSDYEDRQYRSNRACFKRVLKDYQRAIKAMDEKGKYDESYAKEFLLKYREDMAGLFRYYAEGKEKLEDCDICYLEEIAKSPQLNPRHVSLISLKLDTAIEPQKASALLRLLVAKVPQDDMVEIYSKLHRISLSADEIYDLGREEQLKMIRNTPLTVESFCHIMDDLLADSDAMTKGHFILFAIKETWHAKKPGLHKAIIERIAKLPYSRLLLAFALRKLNAKGSFAQTASDPEKEMSTYFTCDYNIVRSNKRMYAEFTVSDPETNTRLLGAMEEKGNLRSLDSALDDLDYPLETIRKVCLDGKEEKYNEAFEANQDALAKTIFDQKKACFKNRHF